MDVYSAIRERRSVRAYRPDPVPEEALRRMLEAARLAPSAKNLQPWKLVVVRDPERRKKLAEAAHGQSFVAEAPVVIAAVALDPERVMRCGVPSYAVDVAIVVDHLTLAAVQEGLGTCWIGSFSQEEARKVLGVPEKYMVVALLPVGYPADEPLPKWRKELDELVCHEVFRE
ncbi:MAG: nitroreductase family protein [Candidatus Hadarchaeales archaeon]